MRGWRKIGPVPEAIVSMYDKGSACCSSPLMPLPILEVEMNSGNLKASHNLEEKVKKVCLESTVRENSDLCIWAG